MAKQLMSSYPLDDNRCLGIQEDVELLDFDTLGLAVARCEERMPISDCEVRDPRIRRTRQSLQSALGDLLQTNPFEDISVLDITEKATVNRATFYDHYDDKFALLNAMVAGGFHELLHERNVQFDGTCPSAATGIIQATCDYLATIRAKHPDCGGRAAFDPLIDAAILEAIRRVLHGRPGSGAAQRLSPVALSGVAWAIYGAAKQWTMEVDRAPVEDAVKQILGLVLPMLQPGVETKSLAIARG
jgi:AcrR family transcriptional regulator